MGTLRLFLAAAVLIYHGGGIPGLRIVSGDAAVQIFYIVSGFLIAFILNEKYTEPEGLRLFYTNRYLRIYVPYITVFAAMILYLLWLYSAGAGGLIGDLVSHSDFLQPATRAYLLFTNFFVFGQDMSTWLGIDSSGALHFAPDATEPDLSPVRFSPIMPAWSLGLELAFYVIAPFLLRRSIWVIAAVFLASLALRSVLFAQGYFWGTWTYRFFPFELATFLSGALAYRLWAAAGGVPAAWRRWAPLLVAAAVLGLPWFSLDRYGFFSPARVALFLIVAALLPPLFEATRRSRWDYALGLLSYPIYLIHAPVGYILDGQPSLWSLPKPSPMTRLALIAAATLLLSVLLVRFVEAPLERYRQRRVGRRSSRSAVPHLAPVPLAP